MADRAGRAIVRIDERWLRSALGIPDAVTIGSVTVDPMTNDLTIVVVHPDIPDVEHQIGPHHGHLTRTVDDTGATDHALHVRVWRRNAPTDEEVTIR